MSLGDIGATVIGASLVAGLVVWVGTDWNSADSGHHGFAKVRGSRSRKRLLAFVGAAVLLGVVLILIGS